MTLQAGRDIKLFSGIMDADTESRFVKDGNYRYLLNARNTINTAGSFGSVEDVMGNILIGNSYLQTGRNKCIGTYEDIAGQSCIFFVWNSNGYHAIFRWFSNKSGYANGVIEKVYQVVDPTAYDKFTPNPLGFEEHHLITGVNLVEDILYFTDGNQQPKAIDIVKANETDKRRKFNIYVNQNRVGEDTDYSLLVQINGSVTTLNFACTSATDTLASRVSDMVSKMSSTLFTVEDKQTYIELTINTTGISSVSLSDRLSNPVGPWIVNNVTFAENFYPDYLTTLYDDLKYNALSAWCTNTIKADEICAPTAKYVFNGNGQNLVRARIASNSISTPITTTNIGLGVDNDSTGGYFDNTGRFVLGTISTSGAGGYFVYESANSVLQATVRVSVDITGVTTTNATYKFGLYDDISGWIEQVQTGSISQTTFSKDFDFTVNFVGTSSTSRYVYPRFTLENVNVGAQFSCDYGVIEFQVNTASNKINYLTPYLFRTRYVYNDNQNSVYSAVSTTPKPLFYQENAIEIDFSDTHLTDKNYGWQIKKVVLSLSYDAGATWFDFKELSRSDYVNSPVYYFNGNEALIPVASSEVVLPYHSVPLKAKSQEYIDDRVWYGGITEGYNGVDVDITIDVQYKDIEDDSIYPDQFIHDTVVSTESPTGYQDYGSFWKRGWEGELGIVYYDDYDRCSTVCLSDKSKVKTLFWNEQNINGTTEDLNSVPVLNWSISHEPPSWATKYQWVRTKNLQGETWTEWFPRVRYAGRGYKLVPQGADIELWDPTKEYSKYDIVAYLPEITGAPPTGPEFNLHAHVLTAGDDTAEVVYGTGALAVGMIIKDDTGVFSRVTRITEIIDATHIRFDTPALKAGNPKVWFISENMLIQYVGESGTKGITWSQIGQFIPNMGIVSYNWTTPDPEVWLPYPTFLKYTVFEFNTLSQYDSTIPFTYIKGDSLKVYGTYVGGTTALPYTQYTIDAVSGSQVFVENILTKSRAMSVINDEPTIYVELSSPLPDSDKKIFYEFGECYEVKSAEINGVVKKYHEGPTQDQTYGLSPSNIVTPATGTFAWGSGNSWYRVINPNSIDPAGVFGGLQLVCRTTFNEKATSPSSNNGRAKAVLEIGEVERPSTFRFSDQYVSTGIYGLSAFQAANEVQYSTAFGWITRMVVVNNDVLKLIFSNSYQLSVYVNQGIIRQTQGGDNIISQSDQVAGNSHLIQRTLGTVNAECVVLNDEGDVMGYDENEGVAWRASGNGLVQISDYLQKSTFKRFSNERRLLDRDKSECPAIYDLYHDEFIITMGALAPQAQVLPKATIAMFDVDPAVTVNLIQIRVYPNNTLVYSGGIVGTSLNNTLENAVNNFGFGWSASQDENGVTVTAPALSYGNATLQVTMNYGAGLTKTYTASFDKGQKAGTGTAFTPVTIAFNKQKQGWTSYYSFTPEYYGRVRDFIVSFKDGQMWLHDKALVAKNFYGVQYGRTLKYISHKDFPKVKNFKALSVNGLGVNSAVATIEPYEGVPNGMLSYLPSAAFKLLEGVQYAAFLRDRLTPNFTDQAVAMLNGRQLRGQTVEVTLNNNDSSKSVVYSSDVIYFYSEHS